MIRKRVNQCQKPSDHDKWFECLGCGTVYAKYEVKQEAHLTTLIDPDTDPFDRDKNIIESVRERRKFDSTGKRYSIELYRQKFDQRAHLGLCKVDTELPACTFFIFHHYLSEQHLF